MLDSQNEEIQKVALREGAVMGINFPSEDSFSDLVEAHKLAVKWFGAAIKTLPNSKHKSLRKRWFGDYDEDNYKQVLMYFRTCEAKVKEHFIYFFLPPDLNRKDWLAHVDQSLYGKEQHFINIHELFFKKNPDIQVLTLVHEITHDIMETKDVTFDIKGKEYEAYGEDSCVELAKREPAEAAVNAESFACYARDAYKLLYMKRKKMRESESESESDGKEDRKGKQKRRKVNKKDKLQKEVTEKKVRGPDSKKRKGVSDSKGETPRRKKTKKGVTTKGMTSDKRGVSEGEGESDSEEGTPWQKK